MACRFNKNTGMGLLVVVLGIILVSVGLLAACSRTQTPTSTMATTSATATTTTVKPTATSTSTTVTTSATSTVTTATTSATSTATTVSAASFYKDNVVTIIVPSAPGGGTDYAARLIANYWTQITGGRMVVENKSGGGGLLGVNYAYAAKPDGLTMGEAIKSSILTSALAQDPAVKFDLKKMEWIGFTNPGAAEGIVVGAKSPYKSMQDLMKANGLKFASSATSSAQGAGLVIELFGLKDARIVLGYAGTSEIQLAVAKGEADAYNMDGASLQDGVEKGFNTKSFLTVDFVRSPYFPDAPSVPELVKLSPGQEKLVATFAALRGGQTFWFQPGVPQDRIEFVRSAFDKIVALDAFKKQSLLRWPIYVAPISGKDFAADMQKTMAAATPEDFNGLQALVDKYAR